MSSITNFLVHKKVDVLGISETHLLPSMSSSFIQIPGYSVIRCDTDTGIHKHGVCAYIKCGLKHEEVHCPCNNALAFRLVDFDLYVVVVYRPPSNSDIENQSLLAAIRSLCTGHEAVIVGDFNLPTLSWNALSDPVLPSTPRDLAFLNCFNVLGLLQWVLEPTFPRSGNILDLVLTTENDRVGDVVVDPPLPKCDHCAVAIRYIFQRTKAPQVKKGGMLFRQWHKGKYLEMNRRLEDVNWNFEFAYRNCNDSYERFCEIVQELTNEFVPVKNKTSSLSPWPCNPPPRLLRQRSALWNEFKRVRTSHGRRSSEATETLNEFRVVNEHIHNFQLSSQGSYEQSLLTKMKDDPKLFHSYIRHRKSGRTSVGPLRLQSGELCDDPAVMCEEFALSFASVYTATIPSNPAPYEHLPQSLTTVDINQDNVKALLDALDVSSAMGPDHIHPHVLKSCSLSLSYPLTLIFQKSLNEGVIPAFWKSSAIVPIFKKGSRCNALNYRPVSLTSVPCKTMERIIIGKLQEYLESNSVLSPEQFGFRSGRTTMDQLLLAYNEVSLAMDKGNAADMVFFDFSKAFDIVSHSVLLDKLLCLGIQGNLLQWLASFLLGRTMSVEVEGNCSSSHQVRSGVPQGSVLGPILFLLFINNIGAGLKCRYKIFADDLKIYSVVAHKGASDLHYQQAVFSLQNDINKLFNTGVSWGLSMNSSKCVVMRFHGGNWDLPPPCYFLNGVPLSIASAYKDLGVIIEPNMRFHQHVRLTTQKAGGLASNLLRCMVCRNPEFMKTLFTSHVRPILDYCSCVWHTGFAQDVRLLEAVQRRWTKEIYGFENFSYGQRLHALNLFSIQGRLLRADLIQYWRILTGRSCIQPESLFTLSHNRHTRGHPLKLLVPDCRTDNRQRSFACRRIKDWNNLPQHVVTAPNQDAFKRELTAHLGSRLFEYAD